jgi:broad specificity phosphatase PhoE
MKKYLILVKHSLPEIVENLPAREWKLSEDGQERAQRLADRLLEYQPDVIISSVEPKAVGTAEIIARKLGLAVDSVSGLHEHDRSNVPFLSKDQFQIATHEFFSKPAELVFGNETADQAYNRFNKAVLSVLNSHQEKTIALVAHGAVISLFVSRLTGAHDFSLWSELGLPSFVVVDLQAHTLVKKENIT